METNENTTEENPSETWDLGEVLENPEKMKLYEQACLRAAQNMAHLMEIEHDEETLRDIVFSLEMTKTDNNARNPMDFEDMLGVNARVLNAAFEFYLGKAHQSPEPDSKIRLAFAAQGLLVRSVEAWRRLSNLQNSGTK